MEYDFTHKDKTMLMVSAFCIVMALLTVVFALLGLQSMEQIKGKWVATESAYGTQVYGLYATIHAHEAAAGVTPVADNR